MGIARPLECKNDFCLELFERFPVYQQTSRCWPSVIERTEVRCPELSQV